MWDEEVVLPWIYPGLGVTGGKAERKGEDWVLPEEFLHDCSLPYSIWSDYYKVGH
jgi:hypothetical protein